MDFCCKRGYTGLYRRLQVNKLCWPIFLMSSGSPKVADSQGQPILGWLRKKAASASTSQCLLQFVYHVHMLHFAAQRIWLAQSCKGCVVGGTVICNGSNSENKFLFQRFTAKKVQNLPLMDAFCVMCVCVCVCVCVWRLCFCVTSCGKCKETRTDGE